ncbi:MAG TPA: 4-(cytidine 5'-diphospho)-2-C-methyl-D-erythritol kinase [Allosphingosinicella sp.]|jgi:4-diphosphocytidyl-2-C-methyl-D-erythritol kinase|nr:4-(cytidine 5'-diphospho)-2-C-methyl-D-erythritol kinase [Allosphingosinicella sp.]
MRETAYAKINLALHVRERMANGYHRIETLFAFCEDGDVLTAEPAGSLSLAVTGPFAADLAEVPDNLVLKAARALGGTAALTLEKRLPVAAGLGGGSADAAAALRLLGAGRPLDAIAARLGADAPACLLSRTARGEGRGDRITPLEIDGLSGAPVLLVNPRIPLATASVFQAWDGTDRGPLGDWREGRNDLEAPARRLVPAIAEALAALADAEIARMSGSGATCFGLYDSDAQRDAAAAAIAAAHPGWWTLATRLR